MPRLRKKTSSDRSHARPHGEDLRGASRLVIDATKRVTDVVEGMHRTIASGPDLLGRPLELPVRAITGLVYGSIRGVTHVVGAGLDVVLAQVAPLLGKSAPGPERTAVLSALNGVIGEYLAETGNPLAIEMCLCREGLPLTLERSALRAAIPAATGRVLVLAHGSVMNDLQWSHGGHDHGAALARDLGFSPVYLRYNSGLHISTNGRLFAALLEDLVAAWPVEITELTIVGHSMGGLVARSACWAAEDAGQMWRSRLTRLVCLGSPHHGAPLERGGNWIDTLLGVSKYSKPLASLGKLRSAGVTDLRYGNVLDEDWRGRDRFAHGGDPRRQLPLPTGVACYAVAGTLTSTPPEDAKRAKRLRGDGLVPVESALGWHTKAEVALRFPEENQSIAYGVGHLDLLGRSEVYATLRSWLSA